MAKGSFKFALSKECGISNLAVVNLGRYIRRDPTGNRGEVSLSKELIKIGTRGTGSLSMKDIGLLSMIVHSYELQQDWRNKGSITLMTSPETESVIKLGNAFVKVAIAYADMDYDDFDKDGMDQMSPQFELNLQLSQSLCKATS